MKKKRTKFPPNETFPFDEIAEAPAPVPTSSVQPAETSAPASSVQPAEDPAAPARQRTALHYGTLKIVPGVAADCYILDDGSACMSERGFADILGMDQKTLNSVRGNWPPKTLEPFCEKGSSIETTLAKVEAENSPHRGRDIVVYDAASMESIIFAYAMAYADDALRANQIHVGRQSARLLQALVGTSIGALIGRTCGRAPEIRRLARHWGDAIFERANALLYEAIPAAYPDSPKEHYKGIMRHSFDYAYQAVIGRERYLRILEGRSASHPVHQHLADPAERRRCVWYIVLLANCLIFRKCRITEARSEADALLRELVAAERGRGKVREGGFDFMREEDGAEPWETEAVHYGELKIDGRTVGDAYILRNGTPGLSENGTAALLGMDHMAMARIGRNGLPKKLRSAVGPDEALRVRPVRVEARNSPFRGRCINFYSAADIELLLRAYATALCLQTLQKNQLHVGRASLKIQRALAQSGLGALIEEVCGVDADIQGRIDRAMRKSRLEAEREFLLAVLSAASPQPDGGQIRSQAGAAFRAGYADALTPAVRKSQRSGRSPAPAHRRSGDARRPRPLSVAPGRADARAAPGRRAGQEGDRPSDPARAVGVVGARLFLWKRSRQAGEAQPRGDAAAGPAGWGEDQEIAAEQAGEELREVRLSSAKKIGTSAQDLYLPRTKAGEQRKSSGMGACKTSGGRMSADRAEIRRCPSSGSLQSTPRDAGSQARHGKERTWEASFCQNRHLPMESPKKSEITTTLFFIIV